MSQRRSEDIYVLYSAAGVVYCAVKTIRQVRRFEVDLQDFGLALVPGTLKHKKVKLIYPRELSVKQLGHVKATLVKKEMYDQNQS
jgi:hypothetical protein